MYVYVCKYFSCLKCTVEYILLLHYTNFKLGYFTVSIIHYQNTNVCMDGCTFHTAITPKRYLASLVVGGRKVAVIQLITTTQPQRMALIKHATHEFSRLSPLPYPCFYSAFAFLNLVCLLSLLIFPQISISPPPSNNSTPTQIIPLLSLITLLHSLRKPFLSRGI